MRVNVEFEIQEHSVCVVEPDGSLLPIFPTWRLLGQTHTDALAATDGEVVSAQMRSAVCTLMADPSYDRWELADHG